MAELPIWVLLGRIKLNQQAPREPAFLLLIRRLDMLQSKQWLPIFVFLVFASLTLYMGKSIADVAQHAAIESSIKAQWEKPDHPIRVPVIVVSGDYAIADWIQAPKGGRALLKHHAGHWQTLMCGDANMKELRHLVDAGVPESEAEKLVLELTQAEASLTVDEQTTINSFVGMVDLLKARHHHE